MRTILLIVCLALLAGGCRLLQPSPEKRAKSAGNPEALRDVQLRNVSPGYGWGPPWLSDGP
jgi:hypothetical protein